MDIKALDGMPLAMRWATVGAFGAGVVGGVVGLIVGLFAYPPTAWFAIFEIGVPMAVLGGLIGLLAGAIASIGSRRT